MQVIIKPYDMLTLIFYNAHSHNYITITVCLKSKSRSDTCNKGTDIFPSLTTCP